MLTFLECGLQGNYTEALPLFERALAINEAALGVDHLTTTRSRELIGSLYVMQGFFDQASLLVEQVLFTRESLHGPDSAWVAASLVSQATILIPQVRAEQYLRAKEDSGYSFRSFAGCFNPL